MAQKTIDFDNDILGPIGSIKSDSSDLENNLSVQKNIANPSKVVKGKAYLTPTNIGTFNDWYILEVPVKANTTYTLWGLNEYCWFSNDNGDTYTKIDKDGGLFTTPSTCTKLLLSNMTGKFYVVNGDFTENKIYKTDIPYGICNTRIDEIESKLEIINYSEKLLNNAEYRDGGFYTYDRNVFVKNDNMSYTGFIKCKEDQLYFTNDKVNSQLCFFDKDFKFIGGVTGKYIFKTPPKCYYTRISILKSLKNVLYINEFSPLTIYVGKGEDFSTIKEAVEFAVRYPNTTVQVKPGIYNLIDEFGSDFLDNMSNGSGIELRNGIHLIFDSGALVKCHYTGSNEYVNHIFSAFNSLTEYIDSTESLVGGITIENLNLECSNIRYAIHDEHSGGNVPYRNIYERCNIKLDNLNNPVHNMSMCIGGGLGQHADIQVKDCTFVSIGSGNDDGKIPAVSWHNNTTGTIGQSRIIITGCYFKGKNNTFRAGYIGDATDITECLVSNNNMGAEPYIKPELEGAHNINMELISFNNFVRTN